MSVTKNYKQMLSSMEIDSLIEVFKQTMINKYYDAFWAKIKFNGIEDDEAEYYLKRQLWKAGCVWLRKDSVTEEPVFCQFAGSDFNHYNFATKATLINTHNAPRSMIPSKLQSVNKDGVIIWLRPNHKGLYDDVIYYINKLAEAETAITINLALQKMPWLICGGSQNLNKLKQLLNNLLGSELAVITDLDASDVEAIQLNAPYIVDKLTAFEERQENKLKTLLGIDNQGGFLNSQQQNLDVTNSNNEEINTSNDSFIETLNKSFKKANKVLGLEISVESTVKKAEQGSTSKGLKDDYGEEKVQHDLLDR